MDDAGHRDLAAQLHAAYRDGPIDPPSQSGQPFSLDDAYTVQTMQVTQWLAAGRRQVGHKVGLTSAAMQRQLGVNQPDYGLLFADMVTTDGGATDISRYLQPRIEPEIAFVLGHDLTGPGVTVADAVRAVDHVLPALEIIDSRIRDWKIGITDTVADNASSAGLVLGSRPTRLERYDLRTIGCVLTVDGAVRATGAGGAVLGSPINALVWLAETLGARGVGLHAGDIVLPGSVTASQPVEAGQSWSATFASLGSVCVRFTESAGDPA